MKSDKKSCNCFYFKIAASGLGIISGISIFFPFLLIYKNYNAALWGLLSGVFAAVCFHLHILFLRNSLQKRYSSRTLRFMKMIGVAASVADLFAFVLYVVLSAVQKQGYQINGYGYAPAATFSLMTFKWTFMLFWDGRRYQKFLEKGPECVVSPLLEENTADSPKVNAGENNILNAI